MNPTLDQLAQEFAQLIGPEPVAGVPVPPPAPKPAPPAAAGAAPAAPTPAPPPPPAPVQVVDFALRGVNLDVAAAPSQVVAAARLLDRNGFSIDTVTGVDWPAQGQMEVVYDFMHFTANLRVSVRARVPRDNPEIPTISGVFPGANWHERETHDFFGIRFAGHPNLKPFLLPEDADYHPLRKDYKP